jgi:hypothetical protein
MNKHNMDIFDRQNSRLVECRPTQTIERVVDVFGPGHALVATYTVRLEDHDCMEAEFEEVALILAERSGQVDEPDFVHLRARCVG